MATVTAQRGVSCSKIWSPDRGERALRAACSGVEARIRLWNGTLSKLRNSRGSERSVGDRAA
jgi:hypothetical protein